MKKLMMFLLMGMFLLTLVSAETDLTELSFEQSTSVDIKVICINEGFCNASATCNASIINPNNLLLVNGSMFQNQIAFHNYTLNSTQTDTLGLYKVQGFCNVGTFTEKIDFTFWITPNGLILTKAEANIYTLMTITVFVLFLMALWAGIGMPFRNPRDGEGKLLSVEMKKYPKLAMVFISYLLFVWLINLLMTMSLNLVSLTQYSGFFVMLFNILLAGAWVMFVAMIWAFFWFGQQDLDLQNFLSRGLTAR